MADRYYNPFQSIDINVPVEYRDDFARYSQTSGGAVIDQSPFPRMVDLWFLAVCVAARLGLKPADPGKYETYKIIDGSIFGNDPWRVHVLMLLAIAQTDSIDIVSEPRRMMAVANGLAISGLGKVMEMLKDGEGDPIWNISEAVEELLRKHRPT